MLDQYWGAPTCGKKISLLHWNSSYNLIHSTWYKAGWINTDASLCLHQILIIQSECHSWRGEHSSQAIPFYSNILQFWSACVNQKPSFPLLAVLQCSAAVAHLLFMNIAEGQQFLKYSRKPVWQQQPLIVKSHCAPCLRVALNFSKFSFPDLDSEVH